MSVGNCADAFEQDAEFILTNGSRNCPELADQEYWWLLKNGKSAAFHSKAIVPRAALKCVKDVEATWLCCSLHHPKKSPVSCVEPVEDRLADAARIREKRATAGE